MKDSSSTSAASDVGVAANNAPNVTSSVASPAAETPKRIKIGEVARHFDVSVDLLRLYEREGLLIPIKSPKGTRYFTELDYPWIATVLRLVREERLNFAGIRHLLALLPCWEIRSCGESRRHECNTAAGSAAPCWTLQACCHLEDCYSCEVYRSACQCKNLKAFIVHGPA
jgi:MerR family transcriptional regulator/heat shock protein HspR